MHISEQSLRRMVADADEQHRSGMATMVDDIRELHEGEGAHALSDARRGLGSSDAAKLAVAIGAATIPLGLLASAAGAQAGDAGLAAFAQSVELAAVEAYKAAASSGKVTTPAVLTAATTFAGHHGEHAAAFGAAAGSSAVTKPNPKLLTAVGGQLGAAADEKAVLKIAYDLENAAAATYLFALGALTSKAALQLTASILPVESQHAVVLGSVLGLKLTDIIPTFQSTDGAVSPTDYPVG